MKNIYKITKGQLISVLIFGAIGFFVAAGESSYSEFATFLTILIPAMLVFYTIGWINFNKINMTDENGKKFSIWNVLPSWKFLLKIIIVAILIIITIVTIYHFKEVKAEKEAKVKLEQEYNAAILNIDNLKTQFTTCIQPTIDKKYQDELRSCNLLKGKVKNDYNFCVSLSSINSPASCLYDYDYESIDCSQETIERKAKLAAINNIPTQCSLSFGMLMDANDTIKEYSNLDKKK